MRTQLLCLLSVLTFAGCMPARVTMRTGVIGKVVDAHTHAPISDANIQLTSPDYAWENRETHTGSDGVFHILQKAEWSLVFFPTWNDPITYKIEVRKAGYHSATQNFVQRPLRDQPTAQLGEIQMKPMSR